MTENEAQCKYTRLDNGVHHLVFTKATNQSLDECFAHLAKIYADHPPDEVLMLLFDLRPEGLPPLRYMMREAQAFYARHPVVPETRAAYIYQASVLVSLGQTLLDFLGLETKRRFFDATKEDEAIAWLLDRSD